MIHIDSEFRALIPPLTADERQQLAANLKADGCRDPLVVWHGLLLDGHHRFEICTDEHLPFQTVEQPCIDRDDAKVWIIKHQFGRRNLSIAQRAELVMHLEPLIAAQAEARKRSGHEALPSKDGKAEKPAKRAPTTNAKLAAIAGTSGPSMDRALAVFKRGTPELKDQMRSGQVSVTAAYGRLMTGEAIMPRPRKAPKPYTHKKTVRKESDVSALLLTLLTEFRQKRKANNDDMKTRKWIPHGISVLAQKQIMDWMDESIEHLVHQLQALMPSASGTPAKPKSRPSTSNGDHDNGHHQTAGTTH